jgi:hypothetical protein
MYLLDAQTSKQQAVKKDAKSFKKEVDSKLDWYYTVNTAKQIAANT